jgi:5-methylcytosine-specific restriction endonuclease McrA
MTIRYELEPLHRNIKDIVLLDDLKRVAHELGSSTVTIRLYDERGRFSASALQRRFGSWHAALERAGLKKVRNVNVPERELFANLAEVWTRLGRQPRTVDLTARSSRLSADTYKRRFKSWRRALEAFVCWANEVKSAAARSEVGQVKRALASPTPSGPRDPSLRLRFLVMRRDNFKCRICGASPALNAGVTLVVDHVDSWDSGGKTVIGNLQTLCEPCNGGKSNLPLNHSEG